jgi:hypothetical protein
MFRSKTILALKLWFFSWKHFAHVARCQIKILKWLITSWFPHVNNFFVLHKWNVIMKKLFLLMLPKGNARTPLVPSHLSCWKMLILMFAYMDVIGARTRQRKVGPRMQSSIIFERLIGWLSKNQLWRRWYATLSLPCKIPI